MKLDANHQPALLLYGTIIEAYGDRGKAYLDDKRYTEAVAAFEKAISLAADLGDNAQASGSENTHVYVHLGAAYIGLKAYQEAIGALQHAIAQDADLVDAHYNLGYAYVEQGAYDEAVPHLERAIAIAPHLKRAHYNLARAHKETGNLEAATNAVTETLRLDADYQPAHELADTIKQVHYNSGVTHLNDERYSEAVTAFQNAITLDADFVTAHYDLGLAYLKMETYPRAVSSLERTVALDPNHKAAYHALALAYLGQQELGKARDAVREALKIDANYQPARSLLEAIDPSFTQLPTPSVSEVQDVTPTESQQHPKLAVQESTPTDASDVKQDLERGLVFLNNRQYDQAAAAFKRVIKVDTSSVEGHYGLGQAYIEMRAFDDAKIAVDTVLRINPNHNQARELLQVIKFARNMERDKTIQKKVLSYAVILGIIIVAAFIANRLNLIPWSTSPAPPNLSIAAALEEPSGNGFLDAGETGRIRLTLTNNGGTLRNIQVGFEPASIAGLRFEKPSPISKLGEDSKETIRISITADKDVKGRNQKLQILLFGKTGLFGKMEPIVTTDYTLKIIPEL